MKLKILKNFRQKYVIFTQLLFHLTERKACFQLIFKKTKQTVRVND